MQNSKRSKKNIGKRTWQRHKSIHPSNHSSWRLERLSLSSEEDSGDSGKMAEKAGTQPATMSEIKAFILSNNEALFKKIDAHAVEAQKRMDELADRIVQNDKSIKDLKSEVNLLEKRQKLFEERCNLEFDSHEKILIQLQDQDRRSSIRIRNLVERSGEDLREIILSWFKEMMPDLEIKDCDVDRVHRVGAKRFRGMTRDVLMKFGSYFKKEQIMKKLRSMVLLQFKGTSVQIYNDLCQQTIQWRRSVKPITEKLRRRVINYSWGYPVFLRFMHGGKQYKITSLDQGNELLKNLGLDADSSPIRAAGGEKGAGASGV